MKIYFVRHGEGHHNANNLYSLPEFELTDKGKKQAQSAAQRVKTLPIELMVISPYKRTIQTAEIINQVLKKPIVYSDLAIEIIRPKEIAGKKMDLPESKRIRKLLDQNFHKPGWHYSDEENFHDLHLRASQFLAFLTTLPNEHILVVSHGIFIKMLFLTMMFKDKVTTEQYLRSYDFLHLETSGLTVCQYKDNDWGLITWNDHSHLG